MSVPDFDKEEPLPAGQAERNKRHLARILDQVRRRDWDDMHTSAAEQPELPDPDQDF